MKDKVNWTGQEYELEWFEDIHFSKLDKIRKGFGCYDKIGRVKILRN